VLASIEATCRVRGVSTSGRTSANRKGASRSERAFTVALASAQRALLSGDFAAAEVDFLRALGIAKALGKADRDLRELRAGLWQAIDPLDAMGSASRLVHRHR
jgi:hypothetical protein